MCIRDSLSGLASSFGSDLSSERGGLARTAEAGTTGSRPGQRVTLTVGNGDDGVIERSMNVGDALSDVLFYLFANFGSSLCHVLSLLLLTSDGLARALAGSSIGTGALTTACLLYTSRCV